MQAHLLTQTLEPPVVKSMHFCQNNLKPGSRFTESVKRIQHTHRECLHKRCFHRELGKISTEFKKKLFSMDLYSGWKVLQLWPLPTRGCETFMSALDLAVQTREKEMKNGKQQKSKARTKARDTCAQNSRR